MRISSHNNEIGYYFSVPVIHLKVWEGHNKAWSLAADENTLSIKLSGKWTANVYQRTLVLLHRQWIKDCLTNLVPCVLKYSTFLV